MIATILAYLADVWIVGTYLITTRRPGRLIWMHWANGVGAFPVAYVEAVGRVWPAFIITTAFGLAGWAGVVQHYRYQPLKEMVQDGQGPQST